MSVRFVSPPTLKANLLVAFSSSFSPVPIISTSVIRLHRTLRLACPLRSISSEPLRTPSCRKHRRDPHNTTPTAMVAPDSAADSSKKPYRGMPFPNGDAGALAVSRAARHTALFVAPDSSAAASATPIHVIPGSDWTAWRDRQPEPARTWLSARGKAKSPGKNAVLLVPVFDGPRTGAFDVILAGFHPKRKSGTHALWTVASLYAALPRNTTFRFGPLPDTLSARDIELAWALAAYKFDFYKSKASRSADDDTADCPEDHESVSPDMPSNAPRLVRITDPTSADAAHGGAAMSATYMVRDLISTTAEDMGPAVLAQAAQTLAAQFPGATCEVTVGDDLLSSSSSTYYPQVYAVGRAAAGDRAPRMIDLRWNDADQAADRIVLIGKGVCYDTGGLSMKNTAGMLSMKKDMGGAAHVLGLARMIMETKLNVRLRVLIPAVENAVSGDSYRPGDVIVSRNNITTEVTNTDAEGRLVLADALVAGCEEKPAFIVDFATLTGAQRVALGADIPGFWIEDDEIAAQLATLSVQESDLMWRLPLHQPYRSKLDSTIADVKNAASGGYGGAITAALYLKEFVDESCLWMHVDMMAFNSSSRPGRPEGGEAMGMRAVYSLLQERWPTKP